MSQDIEVDVDEICEATDDGGLNACLATSSNSGDDTNREYFDVCVELGPEDDVCGAAVPKAARATEEMIEAFMLKLS